ncbi:MAG TPA: hypothetical protein VMT52_11930, partial [Planctomycetota bacterium]|nr:hypothetical protein [Planctomycetota bacterium]
MKESADFQPRLGPLTREIVARARWQGEDYFPSNQPWADHVEELLEFLKAHSQWEDFLPRLTAQRRQRRSALAEAYCAWFLSRKDFKVLGWEQPLETGRTPDLLVHDPGGDEIFVEVKALGWEGEVSAEERNAGRLRKPKEIHAEARSVDPMERVAFRMREASFQLPEGRPTLMIIGDDLFWSPIDVPRDVLEPTIQHSLKDFRQIGAVLLLNPRCIADELLHPCILILNEFADEGSRLSEAAV